MIIDLLVVIIPKSANRRLAFDSKIANREKHLYSANVEVTGDPLEAACGAWHVCDLAKLGLP